MGLVWVVVVVGLGLQEVVGSGGGGGGGWGGASNTLVGGGEGVCATAVPHVTKGMWGGGWSQATTSAFPQSGTVTLAR